MSVRNRPLTELLRRYVYNPKMKEAFGEQFGLNLQATSRFEDNPKKAFYLYRVPKSQKNVIDVMHGGALASLIDVATTISILKMTPRRTISISLDTQFMNPIKIGSQIGV